MELPSLPREFSAVIPYLNKATTATLTESVQPYIDFETKLRQIYAQYPDHKAVGTEHLVPVFGGEQLLTKSRNVDAEDETQKDQYILPLPDHQRRQDKSPATVSDIDKFKDNFGIFSEQSLADLDWSNVVAAGSSVVTPLLPATYQTRRELRTYYHEQLAPASDVDLFLYGLDETQAIEKIKQIEKLVGNSILEDTTTIRTKHAITIVSKYPTRHVQIVLRLYKSITEILTGFDVDCSCVAFDGKQVWASPRALAAFATQCNNIDLTRRSPSYENRLSKYSRRGFEVHWPLIDRSKIDPTIYERAFNRVVGLARLLVLEKLPHPNDRQEYADKRRTERGRPQLPWHVRYRNTLPGNVKEDQPDDVPDWLEDENHSDYHTFAIPYGPRFRAKRIEKLLFKKDLVLNAEWSRHADRKTNLHRHPAFFGSVDDIIQDCCGFCPEPVTDEDLKAHEEESKLYISGKLKFMKDDPGRQSIGSFNPVTTDDWTEMAYTKASSRLCQAIVDNDSDAVKEWLREEDTNVNQRDHTGRTPLQLACLCSSAEIVQLLIEHGARIVARLYNGLTALHIAACRGDAKIVRLLLDKSKANEEEENIKEETRKKSRRAAAATGAVGDDTDHEDMDMVDDTDYKDVKIGDDADHDDMDMVDDDDDDDNSPDDITEGSFVKVSEAQDDEDEPDVYNVDVLAWDSPVSALHLAVLEGHVDVINTLTEEYGADVMLPVKLTLAYNRPSAILSLVMPVQLSSLKARDTVRALLAHGASPAQADQQEHTSLHYLINEAKVDILNLINETKGEVVSKIVNYLILDGGPTFVQHDSPLLTAIRSGSPELVRKVLDLGAKPAIDFETWSKAYTQRFGTMALSDRKAVQKIYNSQLDQPVMEMAKHQRLVNVVSDLVDSGVDVNTLTKEAHNLVATGNHRGVNLKSLLDVVRDRIKELEQPITPNRDLQEPEPLAPSEIQPDLGEYYTWTLTRNHDQAQAIRKEQMQNYNQEILHEKNRDLTGVPEKTETLKKLLTQWQALEQNILGKGGQTFKILHPDINTDFTSPYGHTWHRGRSGHDKDKPFLNEVTFITPDLTNNKRFIKLFEAAYTGDKSTVKDLCLDTKNPLHIATSDSSNFTPFSLAVLRGHHDLAITILDIAAAQYQPPEGQEKKYRYAIRRPDVDDSDDDDNDDDDEIRLHKELIDDNHTIDDIRHLSENIKSKASPLNLFGRPCELWRALSVEESQAKATFKPLAPQRYFHANYTDEQTPNGWFNEMYSREQNRNSFSLFRYAIVTDNMAMLKFLLRLQKDLVYREDDDRSHLHKLQLPPEEFDFALRLGRTDMISEIIRRTGTLLPLANLASQSGVQLDEKPRYYQGLSVYGQKRQDWARQDREAYTNTNGSPLLAAVVSGNIKTVEYFLSETPLRCYEEFAKAFRTDNHIKRLEKAKGGIARALHSWMDTRVNLAVHMAVMADPSVSQPVREFVIKRMRDSIDAKARGSGVSPLQLAFQLRHYEAAKELMAAGADQANRNAAKENLLHTIYVERADTLDPQSFKRLTDMLDPKIARSLTVRRRSGDGEYARTPLMTFLSTCGPNDRNVEPILDAMLELSAEKDLEVMDAAGDYPLHSLLRQADVPMDVVRYLVRRRPDLLFKENATGATPLEIVQNSFFRQYIDAPPMIIPPGRNQVEGGGRDMTKIPAKDFIDPAKLEPTRKQYEARDRYEELVNLVKDHPQRRSLVSLLDANETARRLSDQQRRTNEEVRRKEAMLDEHPMTAQKRYRSEQGEKESEEDEVTWWMAKAKRNMALESELPGDLRHPQRVNRHLLG